MRSILKTHVFRAGAAAGSVALWNYGLALWHLLGFLSTAMPYLLRDAGVPVDRIAGVRALTLAPAIWYFLWSPIVDFGLRRRAWLILMSGVSAACLLAPLLQPLPNGVDIFAGLMGTDCLSNVIAVTIFAFLIRRTLFAQAEPRPPAKQCRMKIGGRSAH